MVNKRNPHLVEASLLDPIYRHLLAENNLPYWEKMPYDYHSPEFIKRSELFRTAFAMAKRIENVQVELKNLPEPEFERFDICEAYYLLENDYNESGLLQERSSNQRRKMSTGFQLHRMSFKPSPLLEYDNLSDNGKAIYKLNEIAILKKMFGIS